MRRFLPHHPHRSQPQPPDFKFNHHPFIFNGHTYIDEDDDEDDVDDDDNDDEHQATPQYFFFKYFIDEEVKIFIQVF